MHPPPSHCTCLLTQSKLDLSFVVSDITQIDMLKTNMQINPANKYHIKDNSSLHEVKVPIHQFSGINRKF